MREIIFSLLIASLLVFENNGQENELKILTINVWSGLDYHGTFKMGEYETFEIRQKRFDSLVKQLKLLQPDIIFIQEANPVSKFASQLAEEINYDEIHTVCNAGIKFGPVGIPTNFKEGIVILANKHLMLEEKETIKLSGSFGIHGDLLTLHFDESTFALIGKIKINYSPLYIVNVHLSADPPTIEEGSARRKIEIERLKYALSKYEDFPMILGGDFNATINSEEIKSLLENNNFFDTFFKNNSNKIFSWNPQDNPNIKFSTNHFNANGEKLSDDEIMSAYYDTVVRKIDYIFLNDKFSQDDVYHAQIVMDSLLDGIHVSDHFGVLTTISLKNVIKNSPKEYLTIQLFKKKIFEPLPIISYDSDAGLGYGVKGFLLNYLGSNESFDIILFNSTKGERWYRFVFSIPDFELRQGKVYPFALDFIVDYDKWIKRSFFGIGNESKYEDRRFYTQELLSLGLYASRGFSNNLIGQFVLNYKTTKNYNIEISPESDSTNFIDDELISSSSKYFSALVNLRYDTRNSMINPSRGSVIQAECEYAPKFNFSNVDFLRLGITIQNYTKLFYPTTILALRFNYQNLQGDNLPIQNLIALGGNQTLRGYPQDRFLDKIAAVANAELRFPIYWRFGGVVGIDLGRVWNKHLEIGINNWHYNSNFGLRFYLETFIVRLDVGISKETTGVYFNFGLIF